MKNNKEFPKELDPIKVCLVGPTPPPFGGIATYVANLLDSDIPGIEFLLFDTKLPEWVVPSSREGKSTYFSIFESGIWSGIKKIAYGLSSYFVFITTLVKNKPQIIQVFTCSYWGYWRNTVYILIAKCFGKKTIFHLLNAIDEFYKNSSSFGKKIIKISLKCADIYLLQSPGLKIWLSRYTNHETFGFWNSIEINKIPPNKFIKKSSTVTGITVGKLGRNKGTYEIIDAIEKLIHNNVNLQWIFVGDGNLQEFIQIANKKRINRNITFTGPVIDCDKWRYLYKSDFFCLPSYAEGQPISIIEAMAIGLPVISSTVGSIPEMITNGENGLLINPGNVNELIEAIQVMLLDKDKRLQMGAKAKEIALERYSHENLCNNLHFVYKRLLSINE